MKQEATTQLRAPYLVERANLAVCSNATLRDLKTVIREGWPGTRKHQQLLPLSGRAVIAEWTSAK